MTQDDRPKLIYLARRHARFNTREAFMHRWRQHAALGMAQPRWRNVALYLHCDRVAGLPPETEAAHCDGVAVVIYRSEAARQSHIADDMARQTMKADEHDTFAQPVAQSALLVRQDVRLMVPLEGWRLFVFWEDKADGFEAAWEAAAQSWSASLQDRAIGHIRNYPVMSTAAWICAGVDEFACEDAGPLEALAARMAASPPIPATPRMAMTRTVVLHDQPQASPG